MALGNLLSLWWCNESKSDAILLKELMEMWIYSNFNSNKQYNRLSVIYIQTYLLLLISMLWHRQAIFKSKGDKLCSSAESRIWTRDPRHQIASRLNAGWQTDWAIEDQAKTWTRQPVPMISEHSAHLTPLSVDFRTWLWRYTYLLLLISMLWHRQAIFKRKGDKLCCSSAESRIWTRDPRHQIASRLNAGWQTDWATYIHTYTHTRTYTYTHTHTHTHTHIYIFMYIAISVELQGIISDFSGENDRAISRVHCNWLYYASTLPNTPARIVLCHSNLFNNGASINP